GHPKMSWLSPGRSDRLNAYPGLRGSMPTYGLWSSTVA
ncbi:hypothetical protein TNCV_764511, partial [Trichonephila clavipes]